ncbi:MAG TPA: phage tail sheath C-terminal domain-containing protein [Bryobacteraceae bacterium]|nr:phage tail sheath C-terminal domain-containing protein [Bryobacteraceae bacterium]
MPLSTYQAPGIYIEEVPSGARPIQAVGTSTAGFVGVAPNAKAYLNEARAINNWSEFCKEFVPEKDGESTPLSHAVYGFFLNGGHRCYVVNVGAGNAVNGGTGGGTGLDVLESIDEIAIVAIPGFSDPASYGAALEHCEGLKNRVAILDASDPVRDIDRLIEPGTVPAPPDAKAGSPKPAATTTGGLRPPVSKGGYGAFYFPSIVVRDPLAPKKTVTVAPCGHMAGVYARTDATRGVHKAPANEPIRGALNVTYRLTSDEQGKLNQNGVNCIRLFPRDGILVWGARTLDEGSSPWRYLNVRRLFIMIEESIKRSTGWVVFEPNDPSLWKSIRRDVSAFLRLVWRDGALMGTTPEEAFFVKCDTETNPPEVIDAGQVVILIGIAPVKPAEFVIFRIGQSASGVQTEFL